MSQRSCTVPTIALVGLLLVGVGGLSAGARADVARPLARHFLERSGFTPTAREVDAAMRSPTYAALVSTTLSAASRPQTTASPRFETVRGQRPGDVPPAERPALRKAMRRDVQLMRTTWMTRMRTTPAPLKERMVLFWHNHFVSSAQKVKSPHMLWDQHERFRKHALGNFAALLRDMLEDPALLLYLDNQQNRKAAPNENLARELLELFTLGEGNYGERDVKEAARALTGAGFHRQTGSYRFRRRQHDDGEKTILGVTAHHDAKSLADAILAQPQCAQFITEKMWRTFVSPTPHARSVQVVAARFRASGYDIAALLRDLFQHKAFIGRAAAGDMIKSPVDLVVGTARALQMPLAGKDTTGFMVKATNQMGQTLFAPPNVRGWPGHAAWINTATLHARQRFLRNAYNKRFLDGDAAAPADLLATAPHRTPATDASPARTLHHLLLDAAYEVK